MSTEKTTITLTKEHKEKAKKISKKIFGKSNLSGLIAYWIINYDFIDCENKTISRTLE